MYAYENRDGDKPKVRDHYICMAEKIYEVNCQCCISVKLFRSLEIHVHCLHLLGERERAEPNLGQAFPELQGSCGVAWGGQIV